MIISSSYAGCNAGCCLLAAAGESVQAVVPVCHCELIDAEKAECQTCGKGYNQEVLQGRAPRFATRFLVASV